MPIIYNQKEIIHIPFDLNNALKLPPQKASYMKDENSARHYQQ